MAGFGANGNVKIVLSSNTGTGETRKLEIPDTMTLAELFAQEFPGQNPKQFKVLVNGESKDGDYRFGDADLVTVTNVNVQAG